MRKPTDRKKREQSLAKKDRKEYLERLKKMALYDAKAYLNVTTDEDGQQHIALKGGKDIDWDILETVEVNEGKVKLKFPERSKAMEKYGKLLMEEDKVDSTSMRAIFIGDTDDDV